jgi:predicted RNase H-like HicB family nuclease
MLQKQALDEDEQEVLEMLVKSALQEGEPLPTPKTHAVA